MNSIEREYFDSPKCGRGHCYCCGLEGHFVKVCKTKKKILIDPRKEIYTKSLKTMISPSPYSLAEEIFPP